MEQDFCYLIFYLKYDIKYMHILPQGMQKIFQSN